MPAQSKPPVVRRLWWIVCAAWMLSITPSAVARGGFSTVVIDAGHGGHDRGGVRNVRVAEKTVALDVSLRLQTLLRRARLRTVMTRSTDVFVSLPDRVAIANAQRDAVFVCIHFNAGRRVGARGIETWYRTEAGYALAAHIQGRLVASLGVEDRGVKRANFFVLRRNRLPAVLVECGFLTNPQDAALADSPRYRQRLAEEIAAAILGRR